MQSTARGGESPLGPDALPPPDPLERHVAFDPDEVAVAERCVSPPSARVLTPPHPALARLIGSVGPGEVLLLGGASDFLLAAAHAFLVEAVRERPADYGRGRTEGTDPRAVVVDGGNGISPYLFARLARDAREDTELLLPRVRLARAFTAYQFVSLLTDSLQAELAREPADLIVVMNVRELFEDEALANDEARQLMRQAAQGLRALAQRHRVPCVVTSPAPARAVRPLSLERIAQKSATRAVLDLSFAAVAGARQERPLGAAGLEPAGRRIDPEQRRLEAWAEMPGRSRIVGAGPAGCPRGRDLIEAHWRPSRAKAQRAGNGRDRPGRQAETASG